MKQQKTFSNAPVLTEDDFVARIIHEAFAIKRLKQDNNLVNVMRIHAKNTFELHLFPVFKTDSPEDIVNRYVDLFPREIEAFIDELRAKRETLKTQSGMSDGGTQLAKMSIPIGLYGAIQQIDARLSFVLLFVIACFPTAI